MWDSGQFSGQELRHSTIFDPLRHFRGVTGDELVSKITSIIDRFEGRSRRLKRQDAEARKRTVECLLANLANAAFNKFGGDKFVALSLDKTNYRDAEISVVTLPKSAGKEPTMSGLSYQSMCVACDALLNAGLAVGAKGVGRYDVLGENNRLGMLTRLRATNELQHLMQDMGVGAANVVSPVQKLVRVAKPSAKLAPASEDILADAILLSKVNERILGAAILLPDAMWAAAKASSKSNTKRTSKDDRQLQHAGDISAIGLYRSFSKQWDLGGRIYGGWWQNLSKALRSQLLVDGEPVVELDYRRLHPSILLARLGRTLDFDPYGLPPYSEDICKETFARMLNMPKQYGNIINKKAKDDSITAGEFTVFYQQYRRHVKDFDPWFFIEEGLRLQREDGDLALSILIELDQAGIVALPIHDSFIVSYRHEGALHASMTKNFELKYGVKPEIRRLQAVSPSVTEMA
jgi:hypothetical protein